MVLTAADVVGPVGKRKGHARQLSEDDIDALANLHRAQVNAPQESSGRRDVHPLYDGGRRTSEVLRNARAGPDYRPTEEVARRPSDQVVVANKIDRPPFVLTGRHIAGFLTVLLIGGISFLYCFFMRNAQDNPANHPPRTGHELESRIVGVPALHDTDVPLERKNDQGDAGEDQETGDKGNRNKNLQQSSKASKVAQTGSKRFVFRRTKGRSACEGCEEVCGCGSNTDTGMEWCWLITLIIVTLAFIWWCGFLVFEVYDLDSYDAQGDSSKLTGLYLTWIAFIVSTIFVIYKVWYWYCNSCTHRDWCHKSKTAKAPEPPAPEKTPKA